jgi:hypothetical protein
MKLVGDRTVFIRTFPIARVHCDAPIPRMTSVDRREVGHFALVFALFAPSCPCS